MHDLFLQLATFSQRYFDTLDIQERRTPWAPHSYTGGYPRGAIVHYTADDDIERVVKWFMRTRYGSRASANVVIADRKYPSLADLADDLPLVQALPVTVVQCQPPNKPTWHATWASWETYGIEALNVGEVRVHGDGFVSHWRRNHDQDEPEWTMPWHHPTKEAIGGWFRHWEPYTTVQVVTIIEILRALREMYGDLEPSWVVGHENVQGVDTSKARTDKRDPGPLMPMRDIRECVFGGTAADSSADWLRAYEARPDYCAIQRDTLVCGWAAMAAGMLPELPPSDVSWLRFQTKITALVTDPRSLFASVGMLALALLGYHVPTIHPEMNDTDKAAVRLFQRMSGLKADAIPGPATRLALSKRLYDRGVLGHGAG